MSNCLVSVIIPVYNAEKYISDCLLSVLNQTYIEIEIIIINDGSTDNTKIIVESFIDDRICLINQENRGASNAKNVGLNVVKGDFVQYLDADDCLSVDKIETQLRIIGKNRKSIAVCKTIIFEEKIEDGAHEIDTDIINHGGSGKEFLKKLLGAAGRFAMVQPNAYLIPIEIIRKSGPWFTDLYPCPDEDGEYFSRILLNSEEVLFTDGINYYRKQSQSISLSNTYDQDRSFNQLYTVSRKFENIFRLEYDSNIKKLFQYNVSQVVYQFGGHFPSLINEAGMILSQHGIDKFDFLGKCKFQIFQSIFGVRVTMRIRNLLKVLC